VRGVKTADVAIIGAGVIGACIAETLARAARLHIVLLERGTPGCEASNASAGVLAVASGQARRGVLLELRRLSAEMFPPLVDRLQQDSGIDLGYRRDGLVSLAFSEAEAVALQALVLHREEQGMRCQMLSPAEAARLEPALNPQLHAAALFPDDRAINGERFVRALIAAAQRRGVELCEQSVVRSVVRSGSAVKLELDGGTIEAGKVIVAAGAWSRQLLEPCGIKVPVRPARGEMLAVRPVGWGLRRTLVAGDAYLVPRDGDEVLIGSTTVFDGFDKHVTAAGIATLRAHAAVMVPWINQAVALRSWAGLRPCSTIRRPIIAPLPDMENVILATGHHRSGILLAPITAQLVAELVTGVSPSVFMRPFSYRSH
jgi:glycine oxidase